MSSSLSEFLAAWNEMIGVQIRDGEIKNCSEPMFRRWLLAVLKEFFVDTQMFENMDNESGSRLRMQRVRLVTHVNHFFKIACPTAKQEFVLIDLIQPTYRRTFNVLNCLLNYVVFVRQLYKNTILDVNEKLEEREKLRTTKNQIRAEYESAKIREENNIKTLKEYETKLPKMRSRIRELEEKLVRQREELVNIKAQCEKSEIDLVEKKSDLLGVRNREVSDQEVESIVSAMETIKQQLEEQDQITEAGRHKLNEHSKLIEEARAMTAKMENIQSSVKLDAGDMKQKKEMIASLSNEINSLHVTISQLTSEMESLTQNLEIKTKFISDMIKQRDELKIQNGIKSSALKMEWKEIDRNLRKLMTKEDLLFSEQQKLTRELNMMYKAVSVAIKHISKHCFDNQD